jgi:hypothetical protein
VAANPKNSIWNLFFILLCKINNMPSRTLIIDHSSKLNKLFLLIISDANFLNKIIVMTHYNRNLIVFNLKSRKMKCNLNQFENCDQLVDLWGYPSSFKIFYRGYKFQVTLNVFFQHDTIFMLPNLF